MWLLTTGENVAVFTNGGHSIDLIAVRKPLMHVVVVMVWGTFIVCM